MLLLPKPGHVSVKCCPIAVDVGEGNQRTVFSVFRLHYLAVATADRLGGLVERRPPPERETLGSNHPFTGRVLPVLQSFTLKTCVQSLSLSSNRGVSLIFCLSVCLSVCLYLSSVSVCACLPLSLSLVLSLSLSLSLSPLSLSLSLSLFLLYFNFVLLSIHHLFMNLLVCYLAI